MPYNTVALRLLKSIINLKFVKGMHATLSYLTRIYEHAVSELVEMHQKRLMEKLIFYW